MSEPVDLDTLGNRNAAALLATGLPPSQWMAIDAELRIIETAGVAVTPEIVTNLAEARLARLDPDDRFVLRRYIEPEASDVRDVENVVYYLRLGNRVKIGYTSNLEARVTAFRPEEVLATEPGGRQREMERHCQFADLRVVGEWFRYEAPLTDWIATLGGHDANA